MSTSQRTTKIGKRQYFTKGQLMERWGMSTMGTYTRLHNGSNGKLPTVRTVVNPDDKRRPYFDAVDVRALEAVIAGNAKARKAAAASKAKAPAKAKAPRKARKVTKVTKARKVTKATAKVAKAA